MLLTDGWGKVDESSNVDGSLVAEGAIFCMRDGPAMIMDRSRYGVLQNDDTAICSLLRKGMRSWLSIYMRRKSFQTRLRDSGGNMIHLQ